MYPRYMLSVKRPKLVFHLVVWGERESDRVSVRERVSASSLCAFPPPFFLLQRLTSLSSCNLHPAFISHPLFLLCTPSSFTVRALRSRANCLLIFCSTDSHQNLFINYCSSLNWIGKINCDLCKHVFGDDLSYFLYKTGH